MSEYDNELRGALFKNKNMREGKKDPEYKGSATIGGVEYWVSSWINTSKAGEKYMSLNFKPKDAQPVAPKYMSLNFKPKDAQPVAPKAEELKAPADTDPFHSDDIPF